MVIVMSIMVVAHVTPASADGTSMTINPDCIVVKAQDMLALGLSMPLMSGA
jgi:hypothetical protein